MSEKKIERPVPVQRGVKPNQDNTWISVKPAQPQPSEKPPAKK